MAPRHVVITDLSGGRNGIDSPIADEFPATQCVEAMNVDFRDGGLGRRRNGSADILASTSHGFVGEIAALDRHTPGEETDGEVWAWDSNFVGTPARLPPGTTWNGVSGGFAFLFATDIPKTVNVSFNGKMFALYHDASSNDRIKVYDAGLNMMRLVGLRPGTNAPTVANQGAGAYPALIRYYRIRWVHLAGAVVVRTSEPTPSVSFTPSGAGAAARVTKPASIIEQETHWRVEFSPDNINWYQATTLPVATTFWDDTTLVANEPNSALSEVAGTYTLPPSSKVGCTDGNRLLFANWHLQGLGSRIGWTPVLGSLDRGDDERMFQTANIRPYIDLDHKNGGSITAMGVVQGLIYVFKFRQIWRLTPTEDLSRPYIARRLTASVGAVSQRSLALGEDASGNPCIYFMSHKGPYRVGPIGGVEYLGRDIEDLTRTVGGKPNINTTASKVIAHSVYYSDLHQWWVWWATGAAVSPTHCAILDTRRATRRDAYGTRGGWSRVDGPIATALSSCLGPYALAATAVLRPWISIPGSPTIWALDQDGAVLDPSGEFVAYITTRSLSRLHARIHIQEPVLSFRPLADPASPVGTQWTMDMQAIRDFGAEVATSTLINPLVTVQGRTYTQIFSGLQIGDAAAIQVTIRDATPNGTNWQLRLPWHAIALKVPVYGDGDLM